MEFGEVLSFCPEATGFGAFTVRYQMLETHGIDIKDKTVAIFGFGNVAGCYKGTELGAKVVTISGPDGYIYDPAGISGEKIDYMLDPRNSGNDISSYADEFPGSTFIPARNLGKSNIDIACHALLSE